MPVALLCRHPARHTERGMWLSIVFYFYLTSSQTGIRDKDVQNSIEHTFLSPLRASVERWMAIPDGVEGMRIFSTRVVDVN